MTIDVLSELKRGMYVQGPVDDTFKPLELARAIFQWEWTPYQTEILNKLLSDDWNRLVLLAPPRHRKPLWTNTQVSLPGGRHKLLGEIEVGDEIISGFGEIRRVRGVYDQGLLPTLRIITRDGDIYSARDHPFLTTNGFKDAGVLRPGDHLISYPQLQPVVVTSVEPAGKRPCRCLDVEIDHTFIANSFIVHNTSIVALYVAITIGFDITSRIMFASHTRDYSALMMNQVEQIMRSPSYRRSFGDLLPDTRSSQVRWTTYERHLPNRPPHIKDPTMLALSPDSGTPGFGASLIVCDDLVSQANSSSPTRRKHLEHWFKASLLKRVDSDGRVLVVGARFYKGDLYGTLLDEGWPHLIYTASPERPLWPARWPAEVLEQKQKEDPIFFPAQYMQDPQDVEGGALDPAWFSFYLQPPDEMAIFVGVDPSITDNSGSKTAYAVVGRTITGDILLLDHWSKRLRGADMLHLINTIQQKYTPTCIAFESNGPQSTVMQLIQNSQELVEGVNLQSVPSLTSKYMRMMSIAGYARTGKLKVPGRLTHSGDIEPTPMAEEFLRAWASFPGGNVDLLDAYEKAVHVALKGPDPAYATARHTDRKRRTKPRSHALPTVFHRNGERIPAVED